MPESYLSRGDTLASVDRPNREGQTFVLREDFVLDFIDLQMRGAMRINTPVIQVFHAEITGEPWGPCLSRDRYIVEKKSGVFTTGRVRFSMQPILLARPARYILVVSNYPPLGGNPASWQYDKDDATYPRGIRISSNDGGDTWTPHYNDDFMFAMWGNPPLIKPYPPPPIDNTAILDITYIHFPDTLFINLSTCDPCHLWAYISETQPRKYMTSRITRGLAVPWHVYYSFVEWLKIEQIELGDTLYHTFRIPGWSECQTKWLTFRGEVDNVESPSVGPIFKHHHTGFTMPEVWFNLDFEIWPDPDEYAHFWTPFWVGSGYGAWDREEVIVQHGLYSAKFTVGGYNHGRGFRQIQDATPWRGMNLTFKAWAHGLIHPMNRLSIGVSGTGAWLRHDRIVTANTWKQLEVSGIIPDDATEIKIDVLGWSPGYGPTYTYFDNITIELTEGAY